jgi:hypothetical protein
MPVGSVSLEFAALVSPPPETLAVLFKVAAPVPPATLCSTVTGILITG